MIRIRRDLEYIMKEGPLKVSVKIRNGHAGSIKIELKGKTKKFIPSPADDIVKFNLGKKDEVISDETHPEIYFRIKVYRTSENPKSLVYITIYDGEDKQDLELNDSFKDSKGKSHDSVKYEIYYDIEEEFNLEKI